MSVKSTKSIRDDLVCLDRKLCDDQFIVQQIYTEAMSIYRGAKSIASNEVLKGDDFLREIKGNLSLILETPIKRLSKFNNVTNSKYTYCCSKDRYESIYDLFLDISNNIFRNLADVEQYLLGIMQELYMLDFDVLGTTCNTKLNNNYVSLTKTIGFKLSACVSEFENVGVVNSNGDIVEERYNEDLIRDLLMEAGAMLYDFGTRKEQYVFTTSNPVYPSSTKPEMTEVKNEVTYNKGVCQYDVDMFV